MKPIPARERNAGLPVRERGVVSILMAFLLVAGVIFILAQTTGIIGTRSMDTSQQLDSTAALMLAESGLQRAEAIVGRVGNGGIMAEADCKGVATGGPFALGRGTFNYSADKTVAAPVGCTEGLCTGCKVNVTGTVGSASRTLEQTYTVGVSNGVAGRGTTVTMVLRNIHDVPATSLFNMVWKRQDPGGNTNAEATFCADNPAGCALQWNLNSSSGNTSVGGIGVTVNIGPNTISRRVNQTISQSRDYVEVGGLFPSLSTTAYPDIVGRFWDDKHVANLTGVNSGSSGGVIYGVAATGTCTNPPTTYPAGGTGSFQSETCTNWCSGADTLVYGVSGRSATSSDQITPSVTFGTNGPSPIGMTRLVHFPNLDGSTPNASGKAFSEIWYAYNKDYMSSNTGAGATSYSAAVYAIAGTTIALSANMGSGDTVMPVASLTAGSELCVGDVLNTAGAITGATVTATPGGACSSASGNYTIDTPATGPVNKITVTPTVTSTTLRVLGATGTLAAGATNNGLVNIVSGPDGSGHYSMTTARTIGPSYITQGVNSTTIRVPPGPALPSVGTRLAVYSLTGTPAGTGSLASDVSVTATGTSSFTVSGAAPGLVGATLCGGICAFFKQATPSEPTPVTEFTVVKSSGTTQFASGFVCLRGVDKDKIAPVTSTTLKTGRWHETIQ